MRKTVSASDVFINCPFDPDYEALFRAMVYAIVDCGFNPRCAKEQFSSAAVRISRIQDIIEECRLGIHDLSRVQLGTSGLPRFNMPYELGLFLGCKRFGGKAHAHKEALVLDSEPYRYQAVLSDIAGQDIRSHANTPSQMIRCIRDWLAGFSTGEIPHAPRMVEDYEVFCARLPLYCEAYSWTPDELSYREYLKLVTSHLRISTR